MAACAPATQPAKQLTFDLGNGASLKLAPIPAGTFMMGCPKTQIGWAAGDEDYHQVTISKPFYMGVTQVTVDQFAAFVKESSYQTDGEKAGDQKTADRGNGTWTHPGIKQTGDHPVVCVSWNDAQAFCQWLSKK